MAGGLGGVPPQIQKRERVAHISNHATSGTQNVGKPKAYGGGERGSRGLRPLAGGVGGVPSQNQKRERVAHISNHATSGTQNAGEPSAYGGGQTRVQGGEAPWQGVWGVSPHKFKRGNESPTLATTPRVGPKTLANPQPTGVGKRGSRGQSPLIQNF